LRLALRVIATLSSIDTRLEEFASRLAATREDLPEAEATALRWILTAAAAATLALAWIAAGQAALCVVAWRGVRGGWFRQASTSNGLRGTRSSHHG